MNWFTLKVICIRYIRRIYKGIPWEVTDLVSIVEQKDTSRFWLMSQELEYMDKKFWIIGLISSIREGYFPMIRYFHDMRPPIYRSLAGTKHLWEIYLMASVDDGKLSCILSFLNICSQIEARINITLILQWMLIRLTDSMIREVILLLVKSSKLQPDWDTLLTTSVIVNNKTAEILSLEKRGKPKTSLEKLLQNPDALEKEIAKYPSGEKIIARQVFIYLLVKKKLINETIF